MGGLRAYKGHALRDMPDFKTDYDFFVARGPHYIGLYVFDAAGMIVGTNLDFRWSRYGAKVLLDILPDLFSSDLLRGPAGLRDRIASRTVTVRARL
jgi:hypothetical protein